MTTVEANTQYLPSVYRDWTDEEFRIEHARVHAETQIEREWIQEAELQPYATDEDIVAAGEAGRLARVSRGSGYIAIEKLRKWDLSRADTNHPEHKHHYSAPYVDLDTRDCMEEITSKWQAEMGFSSRYLSISSLGRSEPYQQRLGKQRRKLTITGDGNISSHQVMRAFDIDACGIVEASDDGSLRSINPRFPNFMPNLVADSRDVLRYILIAQARDGRINFVEELPNTQEHCFHVAVKPDSL